MASTVSEEKSWWQSSWVCDFSIHDIGDIGLVSGLKPEFCFLGRSNVGKSSLINALLGGKYARTSRTPGRTRSLVFFEGRDVFIVDVPGYGYFAAPKELAQNWTKLLEEYLRTSRNLREVYLLVDSRHGFKDLDREMMKILDKIAIGYRVVLTKSDKLRGFKQEEMLKRVEEELLCHPAARPETIVVSSVKGRGINDLRECVGRMI